MLTRFYIDTMEDLRDLRSITRLFEAHELGNFFFEVRGMASMQSTINMKISHIRVKNMP